MTGLGEPTPPPGAEAAAGSSGSEGFQGPPGQLAADGTRDRACLSVLYPGSMSHASGGVGGGRGQSGALPGGGGGGFPGPGLRAATTIPA